MNNSNSPSDSLLYDVIIIGGGLAGLVSAIQLSLAGYKIALIEKKMYPFTKVCGEYISNEVLPFLKSIGFDPFYFDAASINRLRLSSPSGANFNIPLDLGGFGISRFTMDFELSKLAKKYGALVIDTTKIVNVIFENDIFVVETNTKQFLSSKFVIGSYGKREALDKKLNRNFIQERTGYMAVKYHIQTDYPIDEIGLDLFKGGYCGIGKIEGEKYNLCYLYKRSKKFKFNGVKEIEEQLLYKNPNLKNIFQNSQFITREPEVINEISFVKKTQVENHILLCGDTAGLITPLCGNGMSMAIQASKLLCELLIHSNLLKQECITLNERLLLEVSYKEKWNKLFKTRLFIGRSLQQLFSNSNLVEAGIRSIHAIPMLEKWLVKNSHGDVI